MNRLTSHRPPHARSHLARRLLFVAALIAAAGGSLLASATPVLAVPLPAPGGAASGPTAADAVGSGDLACDGVAAADAATCHDRYLEDPSGLLPAYRWSDAVDSVPTGDGGGLGEVVIGSIAKLLFAGAAMAWDVTLSIGRYAFVGFSPLADALERGDEVFAAVAGGVVSSGLFLVAFAVTVWGSLRLAARGRLKRSLANLAIHVSALGLVFVLAAGTAVSPMGLAADVDDLVGDLGGHVADLAPDIGNTTWGDPSAAGGSCGLYLSELAATHGHYASLDEGLASSQAGPAVLSGLWSTTFYPTWAQATFGGADAEGSACRWLEAEAGVTASEQYELLVRSGDEGDPSLDFTATWLSPKVVDPTVWGDDRSSAQLLAFEACRWDPAAGRWTAAPGAFWLWSSYIGDDRCQAYFTESGLLADLVGLGAPDAGELELICDGSWERRDAESGGGELPDCELADVATGAAYPLAWFSNTLPGFEFTSEGEVPAQYQSWFASRLYGDLDGVTVRQGDATQKQDLLDGTGAIDQLRFAGTGLFGLGDKFVANSMDDAVAGARKNLDATVLDPFSGRGCLNHDHDYEGGEAPIFGNDGACRTVAEPSSAAARAVAAAAAGSAVDDFAALVENTGGSNTGDMLVGAVAAFITALVYLVIVGGLSLSVLLAGLGSVLLICLSPIFFTLIAFGPKVSKSGAEDARVRHAGIRGLKLIGSLLLVKLVVIFLLALLLLINTVAAEILPVVADVWVLRAALPIASWFGLKRLLKAVGFGDVANVRGLVAAPALMANRTIAGGSENARIIQASANAKPIAAARGQVKRGADRARTLDAKRRHIQTSTGIGGPGLDEQQQLTAAARRDTVVSKLTPGTNRSASEKQRLAGVAKQLVSGDGQAAHSGAGDATGAAHLRKVRRSWASAHLATPHLGSQGLGSQGGAAGSWADLEQPTLAGRGAAFQRYVNNYGEAGNGNAPADTTAWRSRVAEAALGRAVAPEAVHRADAELPAAAWAAPRDRSTTAEAGPWATARGSVAGTLTAAGRLQRTVDRRVASISRMATSRQWSAARRSAVLQQLLVAIAAHSPGLARYDDALGAWVWTELSTDKQGRVVDAAGKAVDADYVAGFSKRVGSLYIDVVAENDNR